MKRARQVHYCSHLQVTVWDNAYISSDVLTLNISVVFIDDERPKLTSTDLTVTHTEGGGPSNILDITASLSDDDNCPEHQQVAEVRIRLDSFVPGEDVLLDGEGNYLGNSEDGEFDLGSGFASGSGDWMTEFLEPHYIISLTCNQSLYPECYSNILRSLQYNNTAEEPSASNRTIILEVGVTHSCLTCYV